MKELKSSKKNLRNFIKISGAGSTGFKVLRYTQGLIRFEMSIRSGLGYRLARVSGIYIE